MTELRRGRPCLRLAAAAAVAGLLLVAAPARAESSAEWVIYDRSSQVRPVRLDFMVNAGFILSLHTGVSAWMSFPILADGIIGSVNDELSIELGAYLQFHSSYFSCSNRWFRVTPLGGLKWTFYLTRQWRVFAAVRMGASIPFAAENSCNAQQTQFIIVDGSGAIGVYWEPADGLALRFELSNFGPAAGIALTF